MKLLLRQTLLFGVPLTLLGAAFTWDAVHPEAVIIFLTLTPSMLLKYLGLVHPKVFPYVFVVAQSLYFFVIVGVVHLLRRR